MRALAALALLAGTAVAQASPSLVAFGAEGGDFRATLSDGRSLRGADLQGATLNLTLAGQPLALRIDSAERDAGQPDVWLFTLTSEAPDGSRRNHCLPDPDGRALAIPYPAEGGGIGLTCTAGATGKCIRMGYRPWARSPDGEVSLAPFHAACVNLIRAAYTGPERAWTRNGMQIDIYDRIGIQAPGNDPAHAFEAGWTAMGAACVAHPRVPENGSLADIAASAPALPTGAACTETQAHARGALLFNRSTPPG
jgi:hypothetical protein